MVPSLGLDCIFNDFDFISNLYLTCILHLVLSVLIGMSLLVNICRERCKDGKLREAFRMPKVLREALDDDDDDAELMYLRRCFAALDEDHSGELDKQEVAHALKRAGREPSEENVGKLMVKFDRDGNGTINFDEFVTAAHSALKDYRKEKADASLQEDGGAEEAKDGSGDESGTKKLLKEFEELSEALRDCERSDPTLPKNTLKVIAAIKVFEETLKEGNKIHDDDEEGIFLEVAKQLMARSINMHIYLFLILTFLVLVSTSTILFRIFKCREFEVPDEGSQSYLYIDYSVDCSSARYRTARAFAIVNIVIYPVGIPSLYPVLLYRERERLSDPVKMAKEEARGFPNVGHVKFLISAYEPAAYFFEVIECGRRLLLASMIGIVSESAGAAPVIGLLITIAFSLVFAYIQPLKKEDTILGIVLSYSLMLLFVAAMMAMMNTSEDSDNDQEVFGGLMIMVLFAGPATPFVEATAGAVLKLQKRWRGDAGANSSGTAQVNERASSRSLSVDRVPPGSVGEVRTGGGDGGSEAAS